MRLRSTLTLAAVVAALLATSPWASAADRAAVDRIAAVVNGKDVILASDVEAQLGIFLARNGVRPDSTVQDTLRRQILDQMIDEKLLVAEAQRLGLTVPDGELDREVDAAIADVKTRMGGDGPFREQLVAENITEAKLRERYRTEIRQQMLAQKLLQRQFPKLNVTAAEAESYFKEHPDDFPRVPAEVRLSVIQIPFQADSAAVTKGRQEAVRAKRRIEAGERFAKVAADVSDDPQTARSGGDLGFFGRGVLSEMLDSVAFSIRPGVLSDPVRSPLGWHILEVIERDTVRTRAGRDSLDRAGRPVIETHARHILVEVPVTQADADRARALAERVKKDLDKGADFAALAKRHSRYEGPQQEGGDIGFISMAALQPNIRAGIDSVEVGKVSEILVNPQGFNVFKVTDRKPERRYELAEIQEQLPQAVMQIKQREQYETWVKKLRTAARIEIR